MYCSVVHLDSCDFLKVELQVEASLVQHSALLADVSFVAAQLSLYPHVDEPAFSRLAVVIPIL